MTQMVWSLYKDTEGDFDFWELNPVAHYFNYDIDASPNNRLKFFRDGQHVVHFGVHSCVLEVKDGKFDIEAAKKAIGEIVKLDGYWGQYIEGFELRKGKFEVCVGS